MDSRDGKANRAEKGILYVVCSTNEWRGRYVKACSHDQQQLCALIEFDLSCAPSAPILPQTTSRLTSDVVSTVRTTT